MVYPSFMLGRICWGNFHIPHWCYRRLGVSNHLLILKVPSYHNYQLQLVETSIRLYICLIYIYAWGNWLSLPWVLHYRGLIIDYFFSMVSLGQAFLACAGNLVTSENSWVLVWNGTLLIPNILKKEMNYLIPLQQP